MKKRPPLILVIDEQESSRATIRAVLASQESEIHEAESMGAALDSLGHIQPDAVLFDPALSGWNFLDAVGMLHARLGGTPILIVSANQNFGSEAQAMRHGVYDFLRKPVNAGSLRIALGRALEDRRLKDELRLLRGRLSERTNLRSRMGDSDRIQTLVRLLEKISPTPFTVLIEGESGAGKELVARAVHDMSAVQAGPFVAVDCGAIPDNLFESELFGHIKGAFTGAAGDKKGFFEAADGGTLFLDEVCNLSYTAQQKLLRVIEERKVQRIGTTELRPVSVRIIAASNRPLEDDAENRLFRIDLLHRLKEVSVKVPPLRERKEDTGYLARRFLEEFDENLGIPNPGLSAAALEALTEYSWPGNVRELKNVMRQAALTCEDGIPIQPQHLSFRTGMNKKSADLPEGEPGYLPAFPSLEKDTPLAEIVAVYSRELEKRLIEQAIREAGGNKAAAAKRLRIDYTTLHRKRKQLGIN